MSDESQGTPVEPADDAPAPPAAAEPAPAAPDDPAPAAAADPAPVAVADPPSVVVIPGQRAPRTAVPAQRPETSPMAALPRRLLGSWLLLFSALVLGHLLWAWSFAARLTGLESTATAHVRVHWFWIGFSPTVDFALLAVVALTAMAGSAAHMSLIFASRTGHGKLEQTWAFWYLLRPGASALLGVLAYIIVKAGFLGSASDSQGKGLAFAAAVGALSGLFTDTVMAKMRAALGASPFNRSASDPRSAAKTGGAPLE
ncbi:MAG: hypothetical protein ACJ74O_03845 [Frankiaceae bacterium]